MKLSSSMTRAALVLVLALGGSSILRAQESGAAKKEEPAMAWRWANFVILAAGLGYLIGKYTPALFRARDEAIHKEIAEAQAMRKDAEARAAAVDLRVQNLGAEMENLRAKSKAEMQQEGDRIRQETARQIARQEAQAAQEIESAGKQARRELKEYAAKLALELAEQRIRTRVDATAENGLVDAFVADLSQRESKN